MGNEICIVAPQSIEESEKLSATLSRSNLLPEAIRGKPGDILATLLTGAELGLAPMQSLRAIQIIKGKPTLSADLMGALVKRRKDVCDYLQLVTSTDAKAIYETKRVGDPKATTMEFSAAEATRAGLNGDNWRKYPAAMLRARCLSAICRAVYPDLCLGLYDSDSAELDEPQPPPATPEKEINQPPPVTGSRTAQVKAQIAAKTASLVVDVKDGETEEQASARVKADAPPTAQALVPSFSKVEVPKAPTPWDRCVALAKQYGVDEKRVRSLVKGATNKSKPAELTDSDVQAFESSLIVIATEPPPHTDADQP